MVALAHADLENQRTFEGVPTDKRSNISELPAVTAVAAGEVRFTRAQAEIVFDLQRQAEASRSETVEFGGLCFGKGYLARLSEAIREQLSKSGVDLG